jgi:phosphoenolpyruvate carboxylase
MGTQHPDSASKYISIQQEAAEAVAALTPAPKGPGIEEFMIDFEGKMTPYHQTAQIAHSLLDKGLVPGRDVWLTPRVSSATEETVFRQLMALMSIIEADYDIMRSAKQAGGIKEVILPMVRGADDLIAFRRRIADIIELAHKEFGMEGDPNNLQVIPLVEDVPNMVAFPEMYRQYHRLCQAERFDNRRLRFMMARSDSALIYGMPAAVCAVKLMIAGSALLGEELGLESAPIYGGGSLPFRGHVRVENLDRLVEEFSGVRTVTLQSGIRYDHEPRAAGTAAAFLKERLPLRPALRFDQAEEEFIKDVLVRFAAEYMALFSGVAELAAKLADILPQQRDRLTRRGPSGYSRRPADPMELARFTADDELIAKLRSIKMPGEINIPRAIGYTAALYTVGVPPEFIGTGRGLGAVAKAHGKEGIDRLMELYPGLKHDLESAARFLSPKLASRFFSPGFVNDLVREVAATEEYLDVHLMDRQNQAYETLLEIIEPLVRQAVKGESLAAEDRALLKSCTMRLGKMRGSLG